jgi:hypothetical protein
VNSLFRQAHLVVLLFFAGCSASISDDEAKSKSLALLPSATVVSVTGGDEKAVTLQMPSGGTVLVELQGDEVKAVHGKTGPFDYELSPAGALKYTEARYTVLMHKQGDVEAFEYNKDENVWEIYVRAEDGKLYEVKIVADSGGFLSMVEKTAVD